ncbi:uncharacterized protein C7orf50 homolog [Pseudomyrmex gracilis]|uniref:uncharacterized protein C7orf50 homolog n=1 Tax=Pseudomyrmex gracilis TaxID=219809 RepID=UPI0009953E7F|nr:uncharacterized protein C7orf50 homolog [Pseudomyrmex gracilis]
MDSENTMKLEFQHSRKRKSKKETTKDVDNVDSNEHVIKKKQIGKRKKKSIVVQEIKADSTSEKKFENTRSKYSSNENTVKEDVEENTSIPTKLSKRQLKRERVIQIAAEKIQNSKKNAQQKALNYVTMWKHSRSEWKFEKIRQIWLIDNLLDENSIPNTTFPIALEYFEGCKGMARELLLQRGMEVIRKAEEEQDEENKNEIMTSVAYVRARQLLQALPTDR